MSDLAKRRGRRLLLAAAALVAAGTLLPASASAQVVKAPNRNGAAPGDNTSCPPGPNATTKGVPAAGLGDKDVDGDGTDDFFMGEWKFVQGNRNLVVRKWCINKPAAASGAFGDFFSTQVLTSLNGVDTEKLKPTQAFCPFDGGRNLPSGFEDKKDFTKIPPRLDWISGNPKAPNRKNAPDEDYRKRLVTVLDNGEIVFGTMSRDKDKKITFTGQFRIGNQTKNAADLTDADKKILQKDVEQEVSDVTNLYPGVLAAVFPPPQLPAPGYVKMDDDSDGDGITNLADNCPVVYNPGQEDSNNNGVGDACASLQMCDVDRDGNIDIDDVQLIFAVRNLPAQQLPGIEPRDPDGDGLITVNDARICTLRCTDPACTRL